MNENGEHEELKTLLRENNTLIKENNELLNKMQRQARWALVFKILWIAVLLGIPVILYYTLLAPVVDLYSGMGEGNITESLEQFIEEYR